ncbi:MAG: DUF2508 family protein [Oscillospiraceae bacterium]|nr:DUF2508 family protein [Oscillospiraceae bacterium]
MLSGIFDVLPAEQQSDVTNEEAALLQQIRSIKHKMKLAEDLFDLSDDETLTDACIYEMKALNSYYLYLLGEARKSGCRSRGEKQPRANRMLKAAGLL